nr:uncharacterized mitochondrial protein AtMg00810-like [Tanacetum cinerariifolium]
NKALVTKPLNKTPYELLLGRTPNIGFMRPFGYLVTILNTFDPLGNQSNPSAGVQKQFDIEKAGDDNVQQYVFFLVWSFGSKNPHNTDDDVAFGGKKPQFEGEKPESEVHVSPSSSAQIKKHDDKIKREDKSKSHVESSTGYRNLSAEFEDFFDNNINEVNAADSLVAAIGKISTNNTNTLSAAGPSNADVSPTHGKFSYVNTSQYPDDPNIPQLEDITYSDEEDGGAEADLTNLETTIIVSPIPTTRVHKYHPVTQIIGDLSLATQTRNMIRVAKDQGGLSQINNNDFHTYGKSISTPTDNEKPLLKDPDGEDVDVHTYISMIGSLMYLTSSRLDIMGKPHLGLWYPKDSPFNLMAYSDSDYTDAIMDRKSTTGGCQFLGCRLISWQCKKQTVMATSSIEAEYVAAASCCAQVLWIQNQLLDYGAQVGDLSSHYTKYSSHALTQKVFANMRRVGKGFLRADTPLFEGMIVAQHDDDVTDEGAASVADEGAASVAIDNVLDVVDEPSIPSPTPTTQPPPPSQDLLPPHNSISGDHKVKTKGKEVREEEYVKRGIIANIDADEDVTLKDVIVVAKDVDDVQKTTEIEENADVQGRQAESQAQIYQINLEHADKVLSMKDDELDPAELKEVVKVVTTAKLMTEVVTAASATFNHVDTLITVAALTAASSAARKRKGVVIRDPEETATPFIIIHSKSKSKNKLQRKEKEDNPVMRYQALKRKPETKAQARKNMMIYLRNMARFKMDYFKGMKYDDIRPIFKKYFNSNVPFLEKTKEQLEEEESITLKRKTKSQAEKAAKKQKLVEEVEELKRHLQIVLNDEDDVYNEATHLALKVLVVDYEIYTENNKPYYKIIRADGSPQLFLSFLSLLRNFDKEDLEVLWQLVKERFASSKPKNFLDDFLLTTLTYVFEKPDVQA